jgi:hypothetical protein
MSRGESCEETDCTRSVDDDPADQSTGDVTTDLSSVEFADDSRETGSVDTESNADTPDSEGGSDTRVDDSTPEGDTAADTDDDGEMLRRVVGVAGSFLRVSARITFVGVSLLVSFVRESDRANPARRWFLLAGNRWAIVGSLVVSFFLGSLVLGLTNVIGIQESDFVTTMFSTIIAGLFSFVPIVVSVNNVALGRMFDGPDALRDRVDGVRAFRRRVETMAPDVTVSPTDPAGFLSVLAGTLLERTDRLAEAAAVADSTAMPDDGTPAELDAFGDAVGRVAATVRDELDGTAPGVFELLLPMMNHDYSQLVNEARSLRHRVEDPAVAAGRLTGGPRSELFWGDELGGLPVRIVDPPDLVAAFDPVSPCDLLRDADGEAAVRFLYCSAVREWTVARNHTGGHVRFRNKYLADTYCYCENLAGINGSR